MIKRFVLASLAFTLAANVAVTQAQESAAGDIHKGNWISWRGPLQNGVSLESYQNGSFNPEPLWTYDIAGRGTPVIYKDRLYSWGYRGKGPDLEEVLTAHDAETGEVIWERATHDIMSDTVYDRYTIGSPAIDPETENVFLATTYGLVSAYNKAGDLLWRHSMVERFGRLTFPNGRAGAPVIDGEILIIRGVTSYWGKEGPARDRFFGFNKNTGELIWSSTPGVGPPFLSDSSFSTPYLDTRDGKRVFYAGTGCGNIVCVNVKDGTPLWRFQAAKGGINSSPVVEGDHVICVHGVENIMSTASGGLFSIKIPEDLDNTGGVVDEAQGGAPEIPHDTQDWRNFIEMFTSSPLVHDGVVYQISKSGILYAVDAKSGKTKWEFKLSNEQLHASPIFVNGWLVIPMFPGEFYILKPGEDKAEVVHEMKLDGNCIGSAAVCRGRLYVHTTEKLYCFEIKNEGITYDDVPAEPALEPGEATSLLTVPSDVLLKPGDAVSVALEKVDANGVTVGEAGAAEWAKFVPPTAKVKSEMDAEYTGGKLTAPASAQMSAGMFKASSDGLAGFVRGRVIPDLPYAEDFEGFELEETHAVEGVPFDYPPLAWIGGRLKWEVRDLDGNKVLAKTLDRVLFQRSLTFIGDPEASNYTVQADVMTDGNRRIKSVVGLINQCYIISLVGNANILEVSSNHERVKESVPFPIEANVWYTLKTRVDIADDGSGVIRAKAWKRGEAEPEAWTIEVNHKNAHKQGSPGLFGFSPQSQKRVFIDNVSITAN